MITTRSDAQEFGVGIRLGDPTGITVKKHMEGKALELSFGRSRYFVGNYYKNHFSTWYKDTKFDYDEFEYVSEKRDFPIGFQFHYLIQKDINNLLDESVSGLQWYYGFGLQFRSQTFSYHYKYKIAGGPWIYQHGEEVQDVDLGPDGVIGLEYTFPNTPVCIFTDLTLFMEILDDPFLFWMQGGIGARYMF